MNDAARAIIEIACLQQKRLALRHSLVFFAVEFLAQQRQVDGRVVDMPFLVSLDLEDEDVMGVVMGLEALRLRRRQIDIRLEWRMELGLHGAAKRRQLGHLAMQLRRDQSRALGKQLIDPAHIEHAAAQGVFAARDLGFRLGIDQHDFRGMRIGGGQIFVDAVAAEDRGVIARILAMHPQPRFFVVRGEKRLLGDRRDDALEVEYGTRHLASASVGVRTAAAGIAVGIGAAAARIAVGVGAAAARIAIAVRAAATGVVGVGVRAAAARIVGIGVRAPAPRIAIGIRAAALRIAVGIGAAAARIAVRIRTAATWIVGVLVRACAGRVGGLRRARLAGSDERRGAAEDNFRAGQQRATAHAALDRDLFLRQRFFLFLAHVDCPHFHWVIEDT